MFLKVIARRDILNQLVKNMESKIVIVKLNKLRISPRKVSVVADALRNKDYISAKRVLKFAEKKAAQPLLKLLESARANAKNQGLNEDTLSVDSLLIGPGAVLKRGRFVSRGGHHKIMKRTTNITLQLKGLELKEPKVENIKSKKEEVSKKGRVKKNGK